jgi:hypothetical protein
MKYFKTSNVIAMHLIFYRKHNKHTFLRYGRTRKMGSIGVDRCIFPSDLTDSSMNKDLKKNVKH